jgi:hypothetical protein
MLSELVVASLVLGVIASPVTQIPAAANQPIPKTGDNGKPNGIFSFDFAKIIAGGGKGGKSGKARPFVSLT